MLPTALTPEILPLAVALAVAPEIFPLALTPEMLPAKVVEQSAQVRTDAQRIDLALFIVILLVIQKRLLGKLALNWGMLIWRCRSPFLSLPLQITDFGRLLFQRLCRS